MESTTHYSVVVANIGQVHEGYDKMAAEIAYDHYVTLSVKQMGRAAGEDVTLWREGDVIQEHCGQDKDSTTRRFYLAI